MSEWVSESVSEWVRDFVESWGAYAPKNDKKSTEITSKWGDWGVWGGYMKSPHFEVI